MESSAKSNGLDRTQGINKAKTRSTPTLKANNGEKRATSGEETVESMLSSSKPYNDAVKDGCDIESDKTHLTKRKS